MDAAPQPEPDDKDWTWVLDRACPECRYDAAAADPALLGAAIRVQVPVWCQVALAAGSGERPTPTTWSPLEYAAHVRDVHEVFAGRVRLMLAQDDPLFANWDQDATALERDYAHADPAAVAGELAERAEEAASIYDAVPAGARGRSGRRSNGSTFTIASLGAYHLHDLVHHLHDVGRPASAMMGACGTPSSGNASTRPSAPATPGRGRS